MNQFCVTDCRPQGGAAKDKGNSVTNEYGYKSPCCTELRPAKVMGLTVADAGGNNVLTHPYNVYVIPVYTHTCPVHMTAGCFFWPCEEHAWLAWMKTFNGMNIREMSISEKEDSPEMQWILILFSLVPEGNSHHQTFLNH